MIDLSNLTLAAVPVAVVRSAGATQVPAFIPMTPIPKGLSGRLFAIVEVTGAVDFDSDSSPAFELEP